MNAKDYKNARKVLKDGLWASAVYLEALEKQIPKKPRRILEGFAYCPICGDNVNERIDDDFLNHKFCSNCGQHIDWGE